MRIPGTCVVAVSVGDIILRVEVVVVVRGRGGVPGARPLCGHQAAAVQVTSVKTYPNNYCIATLLCKTPHCYITQLQIRHNLCLRLLKLSPTDTPRHTTIRHQPFHQSVVSHSEIPSLFVFFDSVYFIVSKVCIWWQFWFGRHYQLHYHYPGIMPLLSLRFHDWANRDHAKCTDLLIAGR